MRYMLVVGLALSIASAAVADDRRTVTLKQFVEIANRCLAGEQADCQLLCKSGYDEYCRYSCERGDQPACKSTSREPASRGILPGDPTTPPRPY
jgi:hypothetical protein